MRIISALRRVIAKHRTAKLEADREVCRQAYDAALRRGDTRAQHATYLRLKERTNRALAVR
jgi:Tfp pilus assembly protein PilX